VAPAYVFGETLFWTGVLLPGTQVFVGLAWRNTEGYEKAGTQVGKHLAVRWVAFLLMLLQRHCTKDNMAALFVCWRGNRAHQEKVAFQAASSAKLLSVPQSTSKHRSSCDERERGNIHSLKKSN